MDYVYDIIPPVLTIENPVLELQSTKIDPFLLS